MSLVEMAWTRTFMTKSCFRDEWDTKVTRHIGSQKDTSMDMKTLAFREKACGILKGYFM